MSGTTGSSETNADAQVLTRQANSTWVAAIAAVFAAVGAGAPTVTAAFKIDSGTTVAQAIVMVGGFVLTGIALLALALVMSADFRTRSATKVAAVSSTNASETSKCAVTAPTQQAVWLLRVWGHDGARLPVLTARLNQDRHTEYLVVVPGDMAPIWLHEDSIVGYEGAGRFA